MPSPFPGMDPYLESRRLWRDVHARLIVAIGDHLAPRVEPSYYVAVEERITVTPAEPADLLIPNVAVLAAPLAPSPAGSSGGVAVAARPAVAAQIVAVPVYERVRESYLELRAVDGDALITTIELLSPTNKLPGAGRQEYEAKRRQVFLSHPSLVEIDLLRLGQPMEMQPVPASDYLILVLHGWEYPRAQLLAFHLPQPIPEVAVPLREGEAPVPLPLGPLLHEVYDRARYARRLRYAEAPPEPPLAPEITAWLDALLHEHGQRAG
jgi:hypothetical protein